jgi:hemolysin III
MEERREELANTLTHGAALLASIIGAMALIRLAVLGGDPWRVVSTVIFGATLIILYASSTLYHAARSRRAKNQLRLCDRCAIYLLIAGTYTPFMLVALRGDWGLPLLIVVWVIAVAGITLEFFWTSRFRRFSTATYLGMGWLILVAIRPMGRNLPPATIGWLIVGGLVYTAGVYFYQSRRIPYAHTIWHLFVIAGSGCHGVAVGLLLQ